MKKQKVLEKEQDGDELTSVSLGSEDEAETGGDEEDGSSEEDHAGSEEGESEEDGGDQDENEEEDDEKDDGEEDEGDDEDSEEHDNEGDGEEVNLLPTCSIPSNLKLPPLP